MPLLNLDPYPGYTSTQGPSRRTGAGQPGAAAPGTLPGAPAFSYSAAYGGIPQVPNPVTTAAGSVTGNMGNLGSIYNLTGNVNPFNTQQQLTQLESMIPDYGAQTTKSSQNILQELSGQVPSDVINQIIQSSAERGVITGGGPNANAAYLRALGLTSLGMQQQGQKDLSASVARTPLPALARPESFFVNPATMQEAQTASNLYGSAPVPSAAAAEAIRQGNAGVAAGRGSVPQAPGIPMPTFGQGSIGGSSYPSAPLGTTSSNPSPDAYSNWQKWYNNTINPASGYSSGYGDVTTGQFPDYGTNQFQNWSPDPVWGQDNTQFPDYGTNQFQDWSPDPYWGQANPQGPADMMMGDVYMPPGLGAPSTNPFDSSITVDGQ